MEVYSCQRGSRIGQYLRRLIKESSITAGVEPDCCSCFLSPICSCASTHRSRRLTTAGSTPFWIFAVADFHSFWSLTTSFWRGPFCARCIYNLIGSYLHIVVWDHLGSSPECPAPSSPAKNEPGNSPPRNPGRRPTQNFRSTLSHAKNHWVFPKIVPRPPKISVGHDKFSWTSCMMAYRKLGVLFGVHMKLTHGEFTDEG